MTEALSAPARPFRLTRRPEERVRILGCEMDLVRPEEVMHFVVQRLAAGRRTIIANHNLHSLYLVRRNAELREFFSISDLIEVDSIPVLLWARLARRHSRRFHRCTYLDWRDMFWRLACEKGWRVYYLGGAPGVAAEAARRLKLRYPELKLAVRDGYFDMRPGRVEADAVVEAVSAYKPDIVLVGMGMPRQEAWVVHNHQALGACAIFTVGAAFDYEAGVQKPAPRWMGRLGVEWAFRLVADPPRLFRRYCIEPWSLVIPALRDVLIGATARKPPERRKGDRRPPRDGDAAPGRRASDYRGRGNRPGR